MTISSLRLDGRHLAYRQSAGQDHPVILIHGNSSSSRTWQPLLDGPFGERFRCLAFDLPGHGGSAPAPDAESYSLPGYAAVLRRFAEALGAEDALIVGHSLGGHIALEAAPALGRAAGFAVFGTPPMADLAAMPHAFLPNPLVEIGFTPNPTAAEASAYAAGQFAPGSEYPVAPLAADILATDPAARGGLGASLTTGGFADELAVAVALGPALAILHGEHDQLVSGAHLDSLALPELWRGGVQTIVGVGHSPQLERPEALAALLTAFAEDRLRR
ncbi:alpha/beta fold hydrolase [Kitasatospora viridis]|uniref:Pimeloyl-ACP methyl ester carboxylesterase n=1 Tax=Kitasatospora viridis TaxID=281105 RepID=A0A561S9I8_9ACTN|nr:alpha/beta hydrolase [Kitasatospora viridis]TWF71538.1 pimeloyl-ACP methyl ester carboxylesterase [Kitasatospora viridis]